MIFISVLSELIMALSTFYLIPMLDDEVYAAKRSHLIISLLWVVVISACFNAFFYSSNILVQIAILTLNIFKFVVAAMILYKKINIKTICLIFIIHTLCSICIAGISFVISVKQGVATYASELLLLGVRTAFLFFIVFFKRKWEKQYLGKR